MSGSVFVVDPAWLADAGGGGKGANDKYDLHDVDAMAYAYRRLPPWRDTGPALMFMWSTTSAHQAGDDQQLIRALGFRGCCEFVWAKVDEHRPTFGDSAEHELYFRPAARLGMGRWSRCEHEYLTLCRRGSVDATLSPQPRSMIYAPRGEHSAKPELAWTQVIEPITRAVMPGVRGVEFNARVARNGWTAVGRLDGEDHPIVVREG